MKEINKKTKTMDGQTDKLFYRADVQGPIKRKIQLIQSHKTLFNIH